jgi:hypothetical protein
MPRMFDYGPKGIRIAWPRAPLRQWLVGLGSVAALIAALYFIFSALGW